MDVRARETDGPLKNRFQLATPGGGHLLKVGHPSAWG